MALKSQVDSTWSTWLVVKELQKLELQAVSSSRPQISIKVFQSLEIVSTH